jgi:hypothetical protein
MHAADRRELTLASRAERRLCARAGRAANAVVPVPGCNGLLASVTGQVPSMATAGPPGDEEGRALLRLLPADGSPADSAQTPRTLGWNRQRWAGACRGWGNKGTC